MGSGKMIRIIIRIYFPNNIYFVRNNYNLGSKNN